MKVLKKVGQILLKIFAFKLPFALVFILAASLGSALGMYKLMVTYPEKAGLVKGPVIIKKEERSLVAEVGKLMTLPTDEEPTVATVTDPEKLADQFFFKDARKDDRLLVYQNSRKVILYRPSEHRVIEVGVVNVKQPGEGTPVPAGYKLAILDSTRNSGLVSRLETSIKGIDGAVEVSGKDASRLSYNESLLVDVAGNKPEEIKKLADGLRVKSGSLPEGEKKVEGVDFVLLVGSDLVTR